MGSTCHNTIPIQFSLLHVQSNIADLTYWTILLRCRSITKPSPFSFHGRVNVFLEIYTLSQGAPRSFSAGDLPRMLSCSPLLPMVTRKAHFRVQPASLWPNYWCDCNWLLASFVPEIFLSFSLVRVMASCSSRTPSTGTFVSVTLQSICSKMQLQFILLLLSFLLLLAHIYYQ